MALVTVSGDVGCRNEETARLLAHRLGFQHVGESRIRALLDSEFGHNAAIPDKAYPDTLASILAGLAVDHHLVVSAAGAPLCVKDFPGAFRLHLVAPESNRIGNLMLDQHLDRASARKLLATLEQEAREERKRRFGRSSLPPHVFDAVLNAGQMLVEDVVALAESLIFARRLEQEGKLAAGAEARMQFRLRLRLSQHGLRPPDKLSLLRRPFSHPSEEVFANLLDFYRIAWEYEPRTFPIRFDEQGNGVEFFTPDFYLPEFDLYIELTTMKQSLVTRKNRKVKLLKNLYPNLNIQVFYQKDFENLVFKYGLAERVATR